MTKITFNNRQQPFYLSLKSEVDKYFESSKLRKTGNWKLYSKTILLMVSAILLYGTVLWVHLPLPAFLGACCLMGFVLASIGFNVMHDACHGSYSSRPWVNTVMGYTLNALGGNSFIWKFKHNVLHHTYTNVDGIDDDIAKSPLMRQCPSQKWVPAHRLQHIYIVLVYAISSFAWVCIMDFNKYFSRRVHNTPLQKMKTRDHVVFWISKVLYAVFYVIIPAWALGWKLWALGFVAMHITMGFTLAFIFQLAHVVEDLAFVKAEESGHQLIDNEWAIHQVKTTANFAPHSKLISYFVGGLNFQIEHHLFPRVSHIHYPAISRIVKDTCRSYGIDYHEFPTLAKAVGSHFRTMKQLGRKPGNYLHAVN